MATKVIRPHPKLGKKAVYLPNFVLTLVRTPKLPPTFASFIVPLNINKLDLRDYLWNLYGINSLAVRSYIQQPKVQHDKPGALRPSPRRWYRPRSIKHMLVEMEKPFEWSAPPGDFEDWSKETYEAAQAQRERDQDAMRPQARTKPTAERRSMREQAKALLRGDEKWVSLGKGGVQVEEGWEEVETDVDLGRIDSVSAESNGNRRIGDSPVGEAETVVDKTKVER